ncbi:hypothetical protein OF83DRAFT_890555 [Amylostereum chailletii]|nr:hypothetical protein OF83DRAFT_890555 [Amylostereum chailletii]
MSVSARLLPTFDELPAFEGIPGCAWALWGEGDELGTVNLLTDEVVRRAAQEEIRTGRSVSLNWPLNFPDTPLYGRLAPRFESFVNPRKRRDEEIHINTQNSSQWDGLKHFGITKQDVLYQGVPATSLPVGRFAMPDPANVAPEVTKLGIHNWADHGISGRGVLLDLLGFFSKGGRELPYDPWRADAFSVEDLEACAREEGVGFRTGDVLLLRVGFIRKFYEASQEAKESLARPAVNSTYAGIDQSDAMKRFLWNNHFAAIASDQPALERWPPLGNDKALHETLLGLWGMPVGELFDLEGLAKVCAETGRYTFFFSSWPLNVLGGVASPPNAAAMF